MRPVGILLALLSAAYLPWSEANESIELPRTLNINVEVFLGTEFKKLSKYQAIVNDVFQKADQMLMKFKDAYKTAFTFSRVESGDWDDRTISFPKLITKSRASKKAATNIFAYFGNDDGYNKLIRKAGLRGKMCHTEKGYRTLLFNQYDFRKRAQTVVRQARILVYYVGMLLGLTRDPPSTECPSGLMHWENWHRGSDRQTWNVCNARQLRDFFLSTNSANNLCIVRSNFVDASQMPVLTLTIKAFYDFWYGSRKSRIPSIVNTAQELLNKEGQLGVKFDLQLTTAITFSKDTIHGFNIGVSLDKSLPYTTGDENFFIFFTTLEVQSSSAQAHGAMAGKICSADKRHRIFIFTQNEFDAGTLSDDGVARQLVYYIGRSIGVRYDDESKRASCLDGFMRGYGNYKSSTTFTHWNKDNDLVNWNQCNVDDMGEKVAEADCLTTTTKA